MDPDGDPAFHRNEAISAVQDVDQYYGEDDDFDELYNDVNVGDGFLRNSHPPPPPQHAPPPPQNHHQQQQQLPPPPAQLNHHHQHQQQQQLPPPPLPQPPHNSLPQPSHAPLQQQGYAAAVAAPSPSQPPPQPNLPPPPHPPAAPVPPPPQHHQIQQGDGFHRPGGNYSGGPVVVANGAGVGRGDGPGGTTLFVGDLHWWTTDADLEVELSKYGPVKEVRFFDEKASGKSKGYCQVDFYDPAAASACKEGMNGHTFNDRPCVVAFASPNTVRRMGEAQVRNQQPFAAQTSSVQPKGGRGGGGGAGMPHAGGNYGGGRGGGAVSGGGGGGNWGRGGGGGRGPVGNMRNNRMGPAVGRGIGNGMVVPPPPMLPQGGMLGQGFDPGFGAMGRMGGGFGNFPVGPGAGPFPGMLQPFPPVVAPHVNPAFFGRGGMGAGGVGMWPDPSMGAWGAEEQSNYGDDAVSDHQYGEGGSHGKERPPEREWSGASERRRDREKDMPPEQEWPERRHRNEQDMGRERDRDYDRDRERDRERERDRNRERDRDRDRERHRDDRDRNGDYHRHRDRDSERNEDWARGRSSGIRSRSREADHSKRRRMTPQ